MLKRQQSASSQPSGDNLAPVHPLMPPSRMTIVTSRAASGRGGTNDALFGTSQALLFVLFLKFGPPSHHTMVTIPLFCSVRTNMRPNTCDAWDASREEGQRRYLKKQTKLCFNELST